MPVSPVPTSVPTSVPHGPAGPCGPARNEVDTRCVEAERLAGAAAAQQGRLREARQKLAEASAARASVTQVRDWRRFNELKENARVAYHEALGAATGQGAVPAAAAQWLSEIDRLNRELDLAERRADDINRRAANLESALPRIELAADAARIAAEAAQAACLEARRSLAACEEEARRVASGRIGTSASLNQPAVPPPDHAGADATSAPPVRQVPPISLMLRGDRQGLLGLALRLADETGVEAGRLQLLLLELRESIAIRALEDHALAFPDDHPFWSQFSTDESRRLAVSLSSMGYHFDGIGGWADGRAPTVRELAEALSHGGHDPRSLRRPAGQVAIDGMWQGTGVLVENYLVSKAPGLALNEMTALLGPRAARLSELWDMWGRLRPLLLPSAGSTSS